MKYKGSDRDKHLKHSLVISENIYQQMLFIYFVTSLLLEPAYTNQDIRQPNARDIAKVNIMSWVTNEGYYRITAHNGSCV